MEGVIGEGKRVEIAEAALRVINEEGLRRLTISRIARELGVVPSALYRHYRNKGEILDAVLELVKEEFRRNIKEVRKEHMSSLSQLDAILTRHVNFIKLRKALPRILFSEEVVGDSKKRRKKLGEVIKEQINSISEIISEGQKNKEIRDDIDPVTVAIMFLGIVQPAAILWHTTGGEFDLTDHAREAWIVFREFLAS